MEELNKGLGCGTEFSALINPDFFIFLAHNAATDRATLEKNLKNLNDSLHLPESFLFVDTIPIIKDYWPFPTLPISETNPNQGDFF